MIPMQDLVRLRVAAGLTPEGDPVIDDDLDPDTITHAPGNGWRHVQDLNQMPEPGPAADLHEIEPAYLPGLLCRLNPFERWVITELYAPGERVFRSPDEVGQLCGLPGARITEIAERAVLRMRAMQGQSLGAD